MVCLQVALLRQAKASGRLVVLVQALTTPTLVAAAAADCQPPGTFVQGTAVPAAIQVTGYLIGCVPTLCLNLHASMRVQLYVAHANSSSRPHCRRH